MRRKEKILELSPGKVLQLTDDEEKEMVNTICDMISEVIYSRKALLENIITWRKNYEMIADSKNFPWTGSSNLKEPITEITTDAVWARLDRNILAYEPLFLVSPFDREDEDLKISAQKYEAFIHWDFKNNIPNAFKILSDWLFCAVLDGTSFLKVSWLRKAYALHTARGRKIVVSNCPQFFLVDIPDMIFPTFARSLDDSWVAQRIWLSYNDLIIRKEKFGYKIPSNLGQWLSKEDKDEYEREMGNIEGTTVPRTTNPYLPCHMLFEWWGEYRIRGKLIPIVASVFYRERKLARVIVNPNLNLTKPFVSMNMWPRPNRIFGRGMGQKMMHLQAEIDTIHNQRIDATTLRLAPIFKMRAGALSPDDQEFYPLKFFELQDLNDVQEWQLSEVKPSSFQEEVVLQGLVEKSSGVSDYTLGRESSILQTRATATGTLAVIQEGDKKFDKIIHNVSLSFIELMKKVDLYYKENLHEDIPVPELRDILTPEEIGQRYTFEFKPSRMIINREVRQQRELQVNSIFAQNPVLSGNIDLMRKILKELLITFEKYDLAKALDEDPVLNRAIHIQRITTELQYVQALMQIMALQQPQPQPVPGQPIEQPPPGVAGGM